MITIWIGSNKYRDTSMPLLTWVLQWFLSSCNYGILIGKWSSSGIVKNTALISQQSPDNSRSHLNSTFTDLKELKKLIQPQNYLLRLYL